MLLKITDGSKKFLSSTGIYEGAEFEYASSTWGANPFIIVSFYL